jgi:transcriptional regulator with XRE-family HTH domain
MKDKHGIGSRIAQLRQWCKLTQAQMGNRLGYTRSGLSQVESGVIAPPLDLVLAVASNFDIHLDWLISGTGMVWKYTHPDVLKTSGILGAQDADMGLEGSTADVLPIDQAGLLASLEELPEPQRSKLLEQLNQHLGDRAGMGNLKGNLTGNPNAEDKTKRTHVVAHEEGGPQQFTDEDRALYVSGRNVRPVVSTVDAAGHDNIVLVDYRAAAGYLRGYADREWVGNLPAFQIPGLSGRSYRAFQVVGHSMYDTLASGDVVISSYVEDWRHIRDGRVYVLVARTEGITVKRVYNKLTRSGKGFLLCESDNEDFRPFQLLADELMEVWEFQAKITFSLPTPDRGTEKRLTQLEIHVADLLLEAEARTLAKVPQKA